jgi:hypothetical protein
VHRLACMVRQLLANLQSKHLMESVTETLIDKQANRSSWRAG